MTITPGKLWSLRRLADDTGRFKMLAMDQTGPIVKPICAARGTGTAPYDDVATVKRMLGNHLAPHASAVLIDPPLGYAPTVDELSPRKGLILATEWATWVVTETGRKSENIPGWDPSLIRKIGGDAVKVNLWYRHDASDEVRAHQAAYIQSVKDTCRENDIPFVLEFLTYPFPGESDAEFAAKRTDLVLNSLKDPQIMDPNGVDVYKLEPPTETTDVPDPDGPEAARVQARFDSMAKGLGRPWVLLSAGATPEDFIKLLTYAYRAGASGYLAGRAIWADPFRLFPDVAAMEAALADRSVRLMETLNDMTDRLATPWMQQPPFEGVAKAAPAGETFASDYAHLMGRVA